MRPPRGSDAPVPFQSTVQYASQVVDNLPRIAVRHGNRLPSGPAIDFRVLHFQYYFIFGVLGAYRQARYKFKKSYGGGFV